ncbi:zonadhesin-like [Arctopsyche grandis]|uniref:zonadhesin-like n=1 Tax=Arctopsyche grandis TaxID=121162 RepID=UPI00406D7562
MIQGTVMPVLMDNFERLSIVKDLRFSTGLEFDSQSLIAKQLFRSEKALFISTIFWTCNAASPFDVLCALIQRQNEEFSTCATSDCQNTCRFPNRADSGCTQTCTIGCVCLSGYLRNTQNVCVLPAQCDVLPECFGLQCDCPPGFIKNVLNVCTLAPVPIVPTAVALFTSIQTCTGPNEVFSRCGNNGCQRSCIRREIRNCIPVCSTPGCICAVGFVRNAVGICVLPFNCRKGCNIDMHWRQRVCSSPGCVCSIGFVRDATGRCILQQSCPRPICTGLNEVATECGENGCQPSCSRLTVPSSCIPTCTQPGCVCILGLVRNSFGVCVRPSECPLPICTGANEVASACGQDGCQPSCSRLTVPSTCVRVCVRAGCVCATGFVRNAFGACVTPTQCPLPICVGANEVASACGQDGCQRSCSLLTVPSTCTPQCSTAGCVCASGFVRNSIGLCVRPMECPLPTCTGANEITSPCGQDGCQPTCSRYTVPSTCNPVCVTAGCVCRPGFVRNSMGGCVTMSQCPLPTCSGTNEVATTCGQDGCQPSCTNYIVPSTCVPVCNTAGCICATGFVRNSMGACVPMSQCPLPTCSGANEVATTCGQDGCQPSCTNYIVPSTCVPVCNTAGCICATGFVRNSMRACVPMSQCPLPTCSGANEVATTCGQDGCQPSCTNYIVPSTCVPVCNTAGCICATGFVRNSMGACVPMSQCPLPTCSGANEVATTCGQDGCQPSCTNYIVPSTCVPVCNTAGCICATGFVRNSMGACVPMSQCPLPTCSGANEVATTCGQDGCQPSCTNYIVPSTCVPVCNTAGCICATGFVRNSMGACVPMSQCPLPTCSGANEVATTCGQDGCQPSCTNYIVPSTCVPVCNTAGCICATGFVRNLMGACVPMSQCPLPSCSGSNEVATTCGQDGCQPSCTNYIVPSTCVPVCNTAGCICATGFVRNLMGACVPMSQCPLPTCSGANEVATTCGQDGCQPSCTNYIVPSTCVPVCNTAGCICATGFVRNLMGACVPMSQCPLPTCSGANEVATTCGQDGCQPSCTNYIVPSTCVPVCNTAGCICATGFVRNLMGACVPMSQCPLPTCSGSNEVATTCGQDGCQPSCTNYIVPSTCVPVCNTAGCICATGFVRNLMGACVPMSQCPLPSCSGSNEVATTCGQDGCQPSCTNYIVPSTCVPVCNTAGCICATGFVRNLMGACVPMSQCPLPTCSGANEVATTCGQDGCQPSCTNYIVPSTCVPVCNTAGCICATGFVRNLMGACVPMSQCPLPTCSGSNEVATTCGQDGCQPSCTNYIVPSTCVPVCNTAGCICATGFVRNLMGACVPMSQCPLPTCSGANEVATTCGQDGCQPSCTNYIVPSTCVPVCNTAGCICATGFVRNLMGACVPMSQCPLPTCSGSNEVATTCGQDGCQPSCTNYIVPSTCVPVCNTAGCICATGFVRNLMGACVPMSQCSLPTCSGSNEVATTCGQDGCQPSCTNYIVPSTCVPVCNTAGCICATGFVRNLMGACVPMSQCPLPTCSGANEVATTCGQDGCQPSCTNYIVPSTCVPVCNTAGCICATGFVRNLMGACVPMSQCPLPTCTGPNQMATTCGDDGCLPSCSRLTVPPTCVPVCNTAGCVCSTGFVENSAGVCVLPMDCPCGLNEIYSTCGDRVCERTCVVRNPGGGCVPVCDPLGGCVCDTGFLRNIETGTMNKETYFPLVRIGTASNDLCTRLNEIRSNCGDDGCQPTCSRPNTKDCMPKCGKSSCVCASGFVRDESTYECIELNECSSLNYCKYGEIRSPCGVGVCDGECSKTEGDSDIDDCSTADECDFRCFCRPGLVRNSTGYCVRKSDCFL